MNNELLEHCKKEIEDLLIKGLIRKSKSPWSCAAFYVNKQAELERLYDTMDYCRFKKRERERIIVVLILDVIIL